jgi:hypothetical protein
MATVKPRGTPFPKGKSGNPRGRPVGAENKATSDVKEFWGKWLSSKDYRDNLQKRILKGKAPHMETYLAQMCWGKPKETVDLGEDTLAALANTSDADLARRAVDLAARLKG